MASFVTIVHYDRTTGVMEKLIRAEQCTAVFIKTVFQVKIAVTLKHSRMRFLDKSGSRHVFGECVKPCS